MILSGTPISITGAKMSFARAFKRRQKVKKRKSALKGLKRSLRATAGMPTACSSCNKTFDKESDQDSWYVVDKETSLMLLCPDCNENY